MKKVLTIGYALLAVLLLSCNKSLTDENGVEYEAILSEINVSETFLSVSGEDQTKNISITCNSYWTVSSSSTWLTAKTANGKGNSSLTILISANPSTTQSRTSAIVISDGIKKISVNVEQQPTKERLALSETLLDFAYESGSADVDVDSNIGWTATSSASWCTVSTTTSKLTVRAQANNSYSPRSATVSVTGTNSSLSQQITVNQSAAKEPTMGVLSVSDITKTSATCKFTYNSPDIYVQSCGLCYSSTAKEPTTNNTYVSINVSSHSGTPTLGLTGLTHNTTYYIRPYVTTSIGTTYGSVVLFTTEKINSPEEDDNPLPIY